MTDFRAALTTGFADIQQGKVYYEVMGQGHPLVLVHAGIADSRMWDDQFPEFAKHYRAIRYDLRSYGKTESEPTAFSFRQDLYELLQHLGVNQTHLLGISMGGQIALDFTLEHPEVVTALILVAPGVSGYQHQPDTEQKSQFEARRFAELDKSWDKQDYARMQEIELEMWVDGPLQPQGRAPASVRARVREMNAQSYAPDHVSLEFKPQRLDPPAAGRLAEFQVPSLIIVGDLDATSVMASCDLLAQGIAGAQKVVVPGVAHMVNMEKPAEFNRLVLDFLSGV